VSTCTFASSQATNSPFIQMRSAVLTCCPLSEVGEDGLGGLLGAGVAAEVGGAKPRLARPVDGGF